jgi:isopentenyl phosphate kinase
VPEVTYILADLKATAVVTNATNLFGTEAERTTKVVVTAEDGTSVLTYAIVFTVDNTGIYNVGNTKLNIYPVPAIDEITISGLASMNRLEIIDVTGNVIRKIEITGDIVKLNISNLQKGMYFLKTESQTLKFIKK